MNKTYGTSLHVVCWVSGQNSTASVTSLGQNQLQNNVLQVLQLKSNTSLKVAHHKYTMWKKQRAAEKSREKHKVVTRVASATLWNDRWGDFLKFVFENEA